MARSKKSAKAAQAKPSTDVPTDDITLDLSTIHDEASLHAVFSQVFGFPKTYGNNLDALIDCLTTLDDPTASMCEVRVNPHTTVTLILRGLPAFRTAHRSLWDTLQDVFFFVNYRRVEQGDPPLLVLAAPRS